jgi:hypothetical protein
VWGALSLVMVLLTTILGWAGLSLSTAVEGSFPWQMNQILQPIASLFVGGPIAFVCTFVIVFYMYSLRDEFHLYTHTRTFSDKPGRSIPVWALVFFVIAILLAFFLAFFLSSKDSIVAPAGFKLEGMLEEGSMAHLMLKLAMTGCLVFMFVFLALSAGLMAAYEYGKSVDETAQPPIYVDTERLKDEVLEAVRTELKEGELEVSDIKRQERGGISLSVHHRGEKYEPKGDDVVIREDRTWEVEANSRGNLKKIEEKNLRVVQVEGATPPPSEGDGAGDTPPPAQPIDAILDQVRELVGSQTGLRVRRFEKMSDGNITLILGR